MSCLQRSKHTAGQPGLGARPRRGWRQGSTGREGGRRGSARRAGAAQRGHFSEIPSPKPPRQSTRPSAFQPWAGGRGSPTIGRGDAGTVAARMHAPRCPPAGRRVKLGSKQAAFGLLRPWLEQKLLRHSCRGLCGAASPHGEDARDLKAFGASRAGFQGCWVNWKDWEEESAWPKSARRAAMPRRAARRRQRAPCLAAFVTPFETPPDTPLPHANRPARPSGAGSPGFCHALCSPALPAAMGPQARAFSPLIAPSAALRAARLPHR